MGHNSFDTTKRYIADEVLMRNVSMDIEGKLGGKKGKRGKVVEEYTISNVRKTTFHS